MTPDELRRKIEKAESDWKKLADPELKAVAWAVCQDLYEYRDNTAKFRKMTKDNLN